VDRGQNQIAVVAGSNGFGKFYSGREVKHRRRYFQKRREELQKAKKFRALKKWDKKERRWMEAVNHMVSRRIVRFAGYHIDIPFNTKIKINSCLEIINYHHHCRFPIAHYPTSKRSLIKCRQI
jgi:hypothetical protein